jgi:Domain of unknown function (DUF222)
MTPGAVGERATHIAAVRADAAADVVAVRSALVAVREITGWAVAQQAGLVAKLSLLECFPEASIAAATKSSLADSCKTKERSDTLGATPCLAGSLDNGAITAGHVDAVTRASKQLSGAQRDELFERVDQLVDVAAAASVDEFTKRVKLEVKQIQTDDGVDRLERQRRNTRLRSWTDDDGMYCLSGRFDPLTGITLHARLHNTVQALFTKAAPHGCPDDPIEKQRFLTAHALTHLLTGGGTGETVTTDSTASAGTRTSGRPEFVVVIDADAHDYAGPVAQWPIPIEIPARVLADLIVTDDVDVNAVVVRNGVILHAPGNLNLGRTTRLANRAQRRALRSLYRECAMPGCAVGYDHCKLHHITWWRNGGNTNLDNLIPLCTRHHTNIHNNNWTIKLGPHRQLTLQLPDGTIHNTGPPTRHTQ